MPSVGGGKDRIPKARVQWAVVGVKSHLAFQLLVRSIFHLGVNIFFLRSLKLLKSWACLAFPSMSLLEKWQGCSCSMDSRAADGMSTQISDAHSPTARMWTNNYFLASVLTVNLQPGLHRVLLSIDRSLLVLSCKCFVWQGEGLGDNEMGPFRKDMIDWFSIFIKHIRLPSPGRDHQASSLWR